jgi:4-diphosphocytidyl-2-C-methyl-D-erythritol kinase
MSAKILTLPAFAKINLGLRVLGKRPDEYHEIDTVFQTISLHDVITLTAINGPHIILSCDDQAVTKGPDNLAHRAAVALQRHAPDKGVYIRLDKRIPTHAGLGGGSSNAAITLAGLCHLWNLNLSKDELRQTATELGADVPFFFTGGAARGTGTGTTLQAIADALPQFLLVLKPTANISTVAAYAALKAESLTSSEPKTILSRSQADAIHDRFNPGALRNDFESVVFQLEPEIKRAKAALVGAGARGALLAGSGAAVFGIFDNQKAQERAIQMIGLETGWRVFPCMTVGRSDYRRAMGPVGATFARFSGKHAGA